MKPPNSMDTRLSNSRHRLELGRGVIAEGRVTAHPIVEHFDVLEDLLFRFFAIFIKVSGTLFSYGTGGKPWRRRAIGNFRTINIS